MYNSNLSYEQFTFILLKKDKKMDIPSEIVRKIHEIGFYAAEEGDVATALRIFEGMRAVRPDSVYPDIGIAMTLMLTGKSQEAQQLLLKKKAEHPLHEDEIDAMIAFSFDFEQKKDEAKTIFEQIMIRSENPEWVLIAKNYLTGDNSKNL